VMDLEMVGGIVMAAPRRFRHYHGTPILTRGLPPAAFRTHRNAKAASRLGDREFRAGLDIVMAGLAARSGRKTRSEGRRLLAAGLAVPTPA
jgi:hypothetical protein